jgi:transcriptional regulator with XRE-family HTH domain
MRKKARVTQVEIARQVGIDVSSVNKILNRVPGAVFRKETLRHVQEVARLLGYSLGRANRHALIEVLREITAAHPCPLCPACRRAKEILGDYDLARSAPRSRKESVS